MALDIEKIKQELKDNPGMMLDELAKKIGEAYREFGLSPENIKTLLQSKTEESLGELKGMLKMSIDPNKKEMTADEIEKLVVVLKGAKEFITGLSKKEIEELKGVLEKMEIFTPKDDMFFTVQYLPKALLERAQNPVHMGDHITGACLGIVNSAQMVVELLYNIGKGIVQCPYHVYLISSGQAEYTKWKRV